MKTAPIEGAGSQTPTIDQIPSGVGTTPGYDRKVSVYLLSPADINCVVPQAEPLIGGVSA